MSARSARAIGSSLPWLEIALGGALLVSIPAGATIQVIARAGSMALLASFCLVQVAMLLRTTTASCGCFGKPSAVSTGTAARAGMLAGISLVSIVLPVWA